MADETTEAPVTKDRRDYRWSLAAAVILSLATLASAWCGYQAAVWSAVNSDQSRAANGARLDAARQSAIADRQMNSDVLLFTTWVGAEMSGQEQLADEVALRFLPHFVAAFEAWQALPVGQDGRLPDGSPFDRPEYVLPAQAAADQALVTAAAAIADADLAAANNQRYVLSTVLFASVLFLAGIADKLRNRPASHGVVVLADALVAERVRSLSHRFGSLGCHPGFAIDHPGDRLEAHPGRGSHILHGRTRLGGHAPKYGPRLRADVRRAHSAAPRRASRTAGWDVSDATRAAGQTSAPARSIVVKGTTLVLLTSLKIRYRPIANGNPM